MRVKRARRGVAVSLLTVLTAFATTGVAAAEEQGIDSSQAESLVEVHVSSKAAAMRLQLEAESFGIEFNEHYLRHNRNGSYTVTVHGSPSELAALEDAGYEVGVTIEGLSTWLDRIEERQADIREERRADAAALGDPITAASHEGELVILRADYFENYAGRFLSVEAKTRLARIQPDGTGYDPAAPTLSLSWNTGGTTPIDSVPRVMNVNVDTDTTPDSYIEHRVLVRIGEKGEATPPRPTRVRVGSSTGASIEGDVTNWLGPGLPPRASGYLSDFTTRYMDPTEIYARINGLAAEFPNLTQLIPLPHQTNGYQRRAQVTMGTYVTTTLGAPAAAGATSIRLASTANLSIGSRIAIDAGAANHEVATIASFVSPTPPSPTPQVRLLQPLANAHANGAAVQGEPGAGTTLSAAAAAAAVVLTSRAWGHEGGNDISVEFRNPGVANSPLSVDVLGKAMTVNLRTDATAAIASTAIEVINAINAHPGASALVKASPYRNSPANAVVAARWRINLSDFLTTATNAHVPRGPFQNRVLRIGKERDGTQVGVFLYCQQHAREWATGLTCLETAEQLLRNYAIDPQVRQFVDNLDIFILPVSNPDGSHYSLHNFALQRRTMTTWCVEGGEETDDPMAANYWAPRIDPSSGLPYTRNDPASRNLWGVDMNRGNTFGTHYDGYIGASDNCDSDVYAGPAEGSEPEIKNELWVADTFKNIKFSNNIHSFGGYFMWAPGTYLPDRSEGAAVHANIGVEKYFFEAGDRILRRIEEVRDTVILPERTGPIADVLYSAAGNSADEHWYNRSVIAYSFETGADLFVPTTLQANATAGATGVRLTTRQGFAPGDYIIIDTGAAEERRVVQSVAASNPPAPAPNVTLTTPLSATHLAGAQVRGGIQQQGVGFQPDYATEGKFEALEFAAGNYGLLESALAYASDTTPPQVDMTGPRASRTPIDTTFQFVNEPSVIRYTTDGSAPTASSPVWDSTGPREPGQVFHITSTTTFRWLATDIKGNTSTGSARFAIDTAAPVTTASVENSPNGGFATVTFNADDAVASGGAGIDETRYRVNGGAWTTYAGPFSIVGYGDYTVEYYSVDLAGNTEATKSVAVSVQQPERPLARCGVSIQSRRLVAQRSTSVRAIVSLSGTRLGDARVVFRGPGILRTRTATAAGVASVTVRPTRAGTLRVNVRATGGYLGCSATKAIARAPRARPGNVGAGTGGTGGAGLTGRKP